MRKEIFINNDVYHIYNRGVDKREIFLNETYYQRFLSTLEHCLQFNVAYSWLIRQLENAITPRDKHLILAALETKRIEPPVAIIAFCLMPNHFHLTFRQLVDEGISCFMHRVGTAFTNYFNVREERSGRLFEDSFKAVRVESEEQLLHLSRYQHLNPKKLNEQGGVRIQELINYPWSSFSTYLSPTRKRPFWFVNPEPVLASFKNPQDYLEFVQVEIDEFEPLRLNNIAIDDDFGWFSEFRTLSKEIKQNYRERYLEALARA